ncbi:MarC family protein [Flavitalea sp. BT771]|uniref:MarC family protein n=2 Tax=Flavitalea sp. BT771 TaxID=3063329 RepID=UPI0027065BB3|nr:MarC family protein [Flavitalea sp. BT771]MDO6434106.1 MarC family protein [Flavitalea sp. BT771]MDV6223006.1 MarC family protein [Flavitalea sp. BT771]
MGKWMDFDWNQLLTVTFTLFAVIDIIGSIPLLHALKKKLGGLHEGKATLISGLLMIAFLFAGEKLLQVLGVDQRSFAVGGSIVIFILGLEMVLGVEFFKSEPDAKASILVPIAFPLIAGSGTLTTIMSLKTNFETSIVLFAILINLIIIFIVLKSLNSIEKILGQAGMIAVRKFFGVVLLAIAVKIFSSNLRELLK